VTLRMAAAAVALFALLAGCSNKPPVISRVYAHVIYMQDTATGNTSEGLSVFLVASDPDGIENLRTFYVINDEVELFWKVDSTMWVSSNAEGESWIGSNNLVMPGSQPLPAGSYRVLLQNAGGDTSEESFSLASREVSASDAAYPSATVKDGLISVNGSYDAVEVWTYGKDGRFVASFSATPKGPALSVQKMTSSTPALTQGFSFHVYASSTAGYGLLAGPYTVGATGPATPAAVPPVLPPQTPQLTVPSAPGGSTAPQSKGLPGH